MTITEEPPAVDAADPFTEFARCPKCGDQGKSKCACEDCKTLEYELPDGVTAWIECYAGRMELWVLGNVVYSIWGPMPDSMSPILLLAATDDDADLAVAVGERLAKLHMGCAVYVGKVSGKPVRTFAAVPRKKKGER